MNLPARSTVLFDLDGTLADTVDLIVASFKRTISDLLGWAPTEQQCKSWIGRSLRDTFEGLAPGRSQEFVTHYVTWNLANHAGNVDGFPGVNDLLDALRRSGRNYGVVTSKPLRSAIVSMECADLTDRIDLLATEADTTAHKPAPDPLLHALAGLGVAPGDAIYVGDAVVDLQAARAAGMAAIGVTWGAGSAAELAAVEPDAIVDSAAELRTVLGL